MLIQHENHEQVYNEIREISRKEKEAKILICVASDVDAICACHILTAMLRVDNIGYFIIPVANFKMLKSTIQAHVLEKVKCVILLNCGGTIDLIEEYNLMDESASSSSTFSELRIFVMDSRRPYHLSNVSPNNERVIILDHGTDISTIPEELPDEADSEDEKSDSDDGFSDDENARGSRRRKTGTRTFKELSVQKREHRRRIVDYYRASFYGVPISLICYNLAAAFQKDTNDLLWYSIVGLTEQFLYDKIDYAKYEELLNLLQDDVQRRNPHLDEIQESKQSDEDGPITTVPVGYIEHEEAFRFMLLRHWKLYDSMYYSNYVATKLGIWQTTGQKFLDILLTKVGLPLNQCKLNYEVMDKSLKDRLYELMPEYAGKDPFFLNQLVYGSFIRKHATTLTVSASDVVYAITALIEQPTCLINTSTGSDSSSSSSSSLSSLSSLSSSSSTSPSSSSSSSLLDVTSMEDLWAKNFWNAYDALMTGDTPDLLKKGIRCAIQQQETIASEGISMIKRKAFNKVNTFRYSLLESNSGVFTQPMALRKLATFVADGLYMREKEKFPTKAPLPFVACAPGPESYLVVGVATSTVANLGGVTKTYFGDAFRRAADKCNIHVAQEQFDTSIIEVQKDEINKFMEALNVYLESGSKKKP